MTMRVLVISHEPIGPRMAGPAIRCWELARVLGRQFDVTLAAPIAGRPETTEINLLPYDHDDPATRVELEAFATTQADVVISNGYLVMRLPFLQRLPVPWVADLYIPTPVESLAWHTEADPGRRDAEAQHAWRATRLVVQAADWFLCASERQRDFWLGVLSAYGRLDPALYAEDPSLGNLIEVVPFGCPSDRPEPGGATPSDLWPGLDPGHRVILWGGGIWNWFDPLTLLRAMPAVLVRHPEARLAFLGASHPAAEQVPEMARAREARALSQELGLEGKAVVWGNWVPYAERGAYLLAAEAGVSLHQAGVENDLAFRTRLLDAIWAALPVVSTQGDVMSEELARAGVGITVQPGAVDEVAHAINSLLDEPDPRAARRARYQELADRYRWDRVAEPLIRFCRDPRRNPAREQAARLLAAEAGAERAALEREVTRLEALVHGYESGRLMRLLASLHRLRRYLGGR
jgi:glycosyltransferase involved in cell wall biosynthesis